MKKCSCSIGPRFAWCYQRARSQIVSSTASLHARISPGYGIDKIWAIQGADTIRMLGNDEEFFVNNLNPGNWRIWIETKKPYTDAGLDVMNLRPGMNKDLGQIQLQNNCR